MKRFLLHKDFGFGSQFIDPRKRIKYTTLSQLAIKRKMKMELIAEEMRVLYVALTRAKEKLILIGTVKDANKEMEKWLDARNIVNGYYQITYVPERLVIELDCTFII